MQKRKSFEYQLTRLSLCASVPLLLLLLWVMIYAEISIYLILLVAPIGGFVVAYTNAQIHQKSAYQFRSLSNLLDAMIQGDYTLRARAGENHGALDELVYSINGLAERLSQQRLEATESQLLVRTIVEHIDVAILALNEQNIPGLINPAAKKLFRLDGEETHPEIMQQLEWVQQFSSGHNQVVTLSFGPQRGKFNVHVEEFRESGKQHKLLFITDVRTLLRKEERKAWQSLVRVISHEINNSLTPIASISQTLGRLISREGCSELTQPDLTDGLKIISQRANGLSQFVHSYKQLAKLPEPDIQQTSVLKLIEKVASLFGEQNIHIESIDDVQLMIDPLQFEQVFINLIKNAVEAMTPLNSDGVISINWNVENSFFKLSICDQGAGISNLDNLFVPFYTTKKQGSGIGLVLCRQIVEAHRGQLSLTNRTDVTGCCAVIEFPLTR
ncbi:sensor histidine kinase [Aliikangiella coralliicola]|uniref:histidine kinase n=1 Tax=Aliikangiella coralliicola TaxID=2592383 RepID=A0A545UFA7_9GAMM|nr:ATP-binding protein [Aliikangiella coralliicola]TQV88135.1 GHKL domain-containing protein [Aliikangiella coralliicola]